MSEPWNLRESYTFDRNVIAEIQRAANTGISGFIDTKGRILKKSDIFVEAVLSEEIALGGDKSVYTKYGDIFVYICIAATLLMIIGSFIPRRERNY